MFSSEPFRFKPATTVNEIFRCERSDKINHVAFSAFSSRLFINLSLSNGEGSAVYARDISNFLSPDHDSRFDYMICPPAGRIYSMVIANQSANSFAVVEKDASSVTAIAKIYYYYQDHYCLSRIYHLDKFVQIDDSLSIDFDGNILVFLQPRIGQEHLLHSSIIVFDTTQPNLEPTRLRLPGFGNSMLVVRAQDSWIFGLCVDLDVLLCMAWDLQTFQLLERIDIEYSRKREYITAYAFSPDNITKAFAKVQREGSTQVSIEIFRQSSLILKLIDDWGICVRINYLAFSLDGRFLAAIINNQSVSLWDVRSGKKIAQVFNRRIHGSWNHCIFIQDGKTLLISGEKAIYAWELASEAI